MKTRRRIFFAAAIATLALGGAVFAACSPGSDGKATLTLQAGEGGTLSETTYEVPKGASLSDFLDDIVPNAEQGLTFAGWFNGSEAIAEGDVMPEAGLTLTAKYYAEYTVRIYLEQAGGGYSDPQIETGRAFYREPFEYVPTFEFGANDPHYVLDASAANVLSTQQLGKNEVFTVYLARESVFVYYDPALPAGTECAGTIGAVKGRYGGTVVLADGGDFLPPARYRFEGWSEEKGGEVQHAAGEEVVLNGTLHLYAVWNVGYTDRFGGADVIFRSSSEENAVILVRGGREFYGELAGGMFTFDVPNGEQLAGVLYESTFAYLRLGGIEGEYTQAGKDGKLTVDEYNNAVYEAGSARSEGRLVYDPSVGDYTFLLANGERAFRCRFPEGAGSVFEIGGEEAGQYMDFFFVSDDLDSEGYLLFLNGYGEAELLDPAMQTFNGTYTVENETEWEDGTVTYFVSADFGAQAFRFYTLYLDETMSGFFFSDGLEGEYTAEGGTLVLDGFGVFADSAIWTEGSSVLRGKYSIARSDLFGDILTLTSASSDEERKFQLGDGTCTPVGADTLPLYELRRLRLVGAMSLPVDPLLALYGTPQGEGFRAELYTRGTDGRYQLAARGTYTEEELGYNLYLSTFKRTEPVLVSGADIPEEFTYLVGGIAYENVSEEVYYVMESDGVKQYTVFNERNGKGSMWVQPLPMGSLYFAPDGAVYQGTFYDNVQHQDFGGMRTFHFRYINFETGAFTTLSCEAFEENGNYTYELIEETPVALFRMDAYGAPELFASLALDGKEHAVYTDENGKDISASYEESGFTPFGDKTYTLTATELSLDFIRGTYYEVYSDSMVDVYYIYDAETAGIYTSATGESLQLDGYYRAGFTTGAGETEGTYFLSEDGTAIDFMSEDGTQYYFLLEGSALTVLGVEYGDWDMVDDSYASLNYTAHFDGLGGVVFEVGGREFEGSYSITGEYGGLPVCLVSVDLGNGKESFSVSFMQLITGDRFCVLLNKDAFGAFVAEDWSVLVLDGYGYGVYYGADGSAGRKGIYTVYDGEKGFLRFVFSGQYTESISVVLDKAAMRFEVQHYENKTYYADDFSGIRFGEGGEVDLLGEVGYYFVKDGEATAYFLTDGNAYTARPIFAPSAESVQYGGKQYQLWKGGAFEIEGVIKFVNENGQPLADYPDLSAAIRFTPNGNVRFQVPVALTAGGTAYEDFSFAVSYARGAVETEIVYKNEAEYPVTFSREGTLSFVSTGGATVTELNDIENTGLSYGTLTTSTFGYGPIHRIAPTVKGELAYAGGGETYAFTFNVESEDVLVVGQSADYGERYFVRFESGGKNYAMTYYLSEGGYLLHSLAEYSEIEAGGFTVGVLRYLYDRGNFTLLSTEKDAICGMVLFEGDTLLAEYEVEQGEGNLYRYIAQDEEGKEGRTFLISFGEDGLSAEVREQF